MGLNGEITKVKVSMSKYLINKVIIGIYLDISNIIIVQLIYLPMEAYFTLKYFFKIKSHQYYSNKIYKLS